MWKKESDKKESVAVVVMIAISLVAKEREKEIMSDLTERN